MISDRMTFRAGALAIFTAALALNVGTTMGDVLYDATAMTDNGTFNTNVPSQIAAMQPGQPNTIGDMNAADDFTLSGSAYNITSVTGDFGSTAAYGGEGVLVEFFADAGGVPSANPTMAAFATLGSGLNVTPLSLNGVPAGMRLSVDLTDAGITLGEGTWWMSMVVVHETTPSQIYRQLRETGFQNGGEMHIRNGGLAHGNGYGGTWGSFDWVAISAIGNNEAGDLAMKVEGMAIPAPGALTLLSLAGLYRRRRR